MIEIILRDDVGKYETKPFFGLTYRQAGAIALAVFLAYIIFNFGSQIGIPVEILGIVIVVVGGIVGAGFLVKVQGMYGNKRLPILLSYRKRPRTVFSQNRIFKVSDRFDQPKTKKERKKELKEINEAKKLAKFENEFVSENGDCLSPKELKKRAKKTKLK